MQALGRSLRKRFIEELMARFTALWPKQTSQLGNGYRHFMESTVERAMSYGIETESAAARFINLYFVWGPQFETRPEHTWALRILNDANLSGQAKIDDLAFRTKLRLQAMQVNRRHTP